MKRVLTLFLLVFSLYILFPHSKFTIQGDRVYIVKALEGRLILYENGFKVFEESFCNMKNFFISSKEGSKVVLLMDSGDELYIYELESNKKIKEIKFPAEREITLSDSLFPNKVGKKYFNLKKNFEQCKVFDDKLYCMKEVGNGFLFFVYEDEYELSPPLGVKTENGENRGLFIVEYMNKITWRRNPLNSSVMKYMIYRKRKGEPYSSFEKIATVESNTFIYLDKSVGEDYKDYQYGVAVMDVTLTKSPIMADDGTIVYDVEFLRSFFIEKSD